MISAMTLAAGLHVAAEAAANALWRRLPLAVLLHAVDTLDEMDDTVLFKSCDGAWTGESVSNLRERHIGWITVSSGVIIAASIGRMCEPPSTCSISSSSDAVHLT